MSVRTMPKGYMLVLGWSIPARIGGGQRRWARRRTPQIYLHDDPADENTLAPVRPETAAVAILCTIS